MQDQTQDQSKDLTGSSDMSHQITPVESNPLDRRPVMVRTTIHDVAEALSDEQDAYGAEGIGRYLRQIRMQRGISVRDVSNQIRIRPNQVEALEDGRIQDLPGVVYSIGYVRAYANLLGLDGEEAVRRFKMDAPLPEQHDLGLPTAKRESRLPRPVMALSVLLAGVVGYGGWLVWDQQATEPRVADVPAHLETTQQPAQSTTEAAQAPAAQATTAQTTDTAAPETIAPAPEQAASAPITETTAPEGPNLAATPEGEEPQETAQPVTVSGEVGVPAEPTEGQADGAVEPAAAPSAVPDTSDDAPSVQTSVESETTPVEPQETTNTVLTVASAEAATADDLTGRQLGQAADSRISIRAESDAYVQVKDVNDTLFLQRVLRAGDIYHVPDQAGLTLVTSNAGGLAITVDGQSIAPLGEANQILQGVALEPAALAAAAGSETGTVSGAAAN